VNRYRRSDSADLRYVWLKRRQQGTRKRRKLTDSDVCTQEALQEAAPLSREHPLWRLLLLSDGSVTRHLQLLTGSAVRVDCLAMAPAVEESAELPPAVEALAHPLLQREVHHSLPWTWLCCRLASAVLSYIVYMDVLELLEELCDPIVMDITWYLVTELRRWPVARLPAESGNLTAPKGRLSRLPIPQVLLRNQATTDGRRRRALTCQTHP